MKSLIMLLFLISVSVVNLLTPPCLIESDNIDLKSSSFENRIKNADFIFTGKVEALLSNGDVGLLSVKRVYKSTNDGHKFDVRPGRMIRVSGFLVPFDSLPIKKGGTGKKNGKKGENISRRHILDSRQLLEAQRRHRRGGGHAPPRGCSVVRVRDTKLFVVALARRERILYLDTRPLAVTMEALDTTRTTLNNLKDMTYKPRPPILEEPCEKTFCAYGASCHADAGGEARCRCPEDCPSGGTPVCGSDGRSYINECVLRMAACQRQENLRVHHSGECGVVSEPRRSKGSKG